MSYKLKRPLDIAGSLAIGLVTLPIQLGVASALYLQGKLNSAYSGPVLYKAKRVDENLGTFEMLKFRSMTDSEAPESALTQEGLTLIPEERITPVGRIIRRLSLDELPQVLNILKGEMSIVGPRPRSIDEAIYLSTLGYTDVLSQKPGLTSRACTTCLDEGKERRDLTLQEMAQADKGHTYTLYNDLRVIAKTALKGWFHGR